MNTWIPVIAKVRKLVETKVISRFRQPPARRPQFEVQLEFPWNPKR